MLNPRSVLCRATFAAITAASLLGYVSISLAHLATGIFAHYSRQNCSNTFKLDGFRWCTTKSYYRFSIGLRSGFWLCHSKTFKCFPLNHSNVALAVCLGSLSCWKVKLHPSLKSLDAWNRFPSRISLFLAPAIIPSDSQSLQMKIIPRAWCCHHHTSLWGW